MIVLTVRPSTVVSSPGNPPPPALPHQVPPADDPDPFASLLGVIEAYPPGQSGIDGGGFQIIKSASPSYLNIQYEALKKGFYDDLEFLFSDRKGGRSVQVRSASRVGQTDFGVNAIRLNYIGEKLRAKGWQIEEISPKKYPDYFGAANDARDQTFDEDRRRGR